MTDFILTPTPATVRELAAQFGMSETWVRDNLKKVEHEVIPGKPAKYAAPLPTLSTEEVKADEEITPEVQDDNCPFCNAPAGDQTPAGKEGTFLGDSCAFCHHCGKTYNVFTKEEVGEAKAKKPRGEGSGRKILNPQPKINAKVAAVRKAGGTLEYSKHTRLWGLTLPTIEGGVEMDAETFSHFDEVSILLAKP